MPIVKTMESDRHDIVVLGGGLVGMAMAVALSRYGMSVVLIDPAPVADRGSIDFDGRAYAVAPGSRNLLTAIGVWDAVKPQAQPISRIQVADRTEGPCPPGGLHFDPDEIGVQTLGWIVEDHVLRRALLDAVSAGDVVHLAPARAVSVVRDAYCALVALEDGRRIQTAMVVACDGRRSATAQAAGVEYVSWGYSQTGLVSAVAHTAPHHGLAHQGFYSGGPFAVLPMTGDRSALVWSEHAAEAERISALSDAEYLQAVASRIGGRLGALELVGKRWAYPLGLALATRYALPRMVVAGDAAHGVHPIAGQGMNLGLRDVAALTEVLVEAQRLGLDIGTKDVLEGYERWRRFDGTALSLGIDGLNRLFSTSFGPLQAARSVGLELVDRLPGARRAFMNAASGVGDGAPALLRGHAI
ncbi:MAG: UbiH/UbiF/VisC/COQ6 family ubiquinone biosynthesis hydroxylase [Paracoccaceae bacterium]